MGVHGLKKYLLSTCIGQQKLYSEIHISKLAEKKIVFDTNSIIERFLSINTIQDTINLFIKYKKIICEVLKIQPIWVFDGQKYKSFKTIERNELYKTIKIHAKPYFNAIGEGEELCAKMTSDYIGSSDTDVLLFKGNNLIFDLIDGPSKLMKLTTVKVFNLKHILATLKLSHEQFLEGCIFAGTDFIRRGVYGVGLIKAFSFFNDKTTEKVDNAIKKFRSTDAYNNVLQFYKNH